MTGPTITANDRLSLTLFLAAVLHGVVILGVGLDLSPKRPPERPPMIEVTLARDPSTSKPEDYDFLAQANQEGGGEAKDRQRPREADSSPVPDVADQNAAVTAAPRPSPAQAGERARIITSTRADASQASDSDQSKARETVEVEQIDAVRQWASARLAPVDPQDPTARIPSKRYINSSTRAHEAASYLKKWADDVVRVGNLRYPEEARRRGLEGLVTVQATLNPDGSINALKVATQSPYPVLDQAALRIVRLAAPFDPVPAEVLAGEDLLVITRTLVFGSQNILSAD